jgi:hypothetical protein
MLTEDQLLRAMCPPDGGYTEPPADIRADALAMGRRVEATVLAALAERSLLVEVIGGVEGPCLAINNYRVAGPKPWGGGTVQRKWRAKGKDLLTAMQRDLPEDETAPGAGRGEG